MRITGSAQRHIPGLSHKKGTERNVLRPGFPAGSVNGNDFALIVGSACLAYTVRHHKLAALAAFYKVRSAHLPVGSSFISSCL